MSFESDLVGILKQQFDRAGIKYDSRLDACSLAARYLEMITRRITQVPRRVHLSKEIHGSLGNLRREADPKLKKKAHNAWASAILIQHRLTIGDDLRGFLSKGINDAKGKRRIDSLLWDFGMHHFHLSKTFDESGFVERSDYLLFAVVTQVAAYFVDVRRHPNGNDPHDCGWNEQDLLKIVYSNWPELVEPNIVYGVKADVLTDKEKKVLRNSNINHIATIDGKAVAPIGGGTALDGSSMKCTRLAMHLLHEVKKHQTVFDRHPQELRSGLQAKGIEIPGEIEFELVLLDSMNPSNELVNQLTRDQCLSRDLCKMGFAVVERSTRSPMVVTDES